MRAVKACVGAAVLLAVLLLAGGVIRKVAGSGDRAPTKSHASSPGVAVVPAAPRLHGLPTAGAPVSADQKRAQDQAVLAAMRDFERDAMPVIDQCLGPTPTQRIPVPVILTLQRSDADDTHDRFTVAAVQAAPVRGAILDPNSAAVRCLRMLDGRAVSIAAGNAPDQFAQVLTLFLPVPADLAARRGQLPTR